ncbi:hypothetical protein EIP91_003418, partial [Steccherinum ochraceum]
MGIALLCDVSTSVVVVQYPDAVCAPHIRQQEWVNAAPARTQTNPFAQPHAAMLSVKSLAFLFASSLSVSVAHASPITGSYANETNVVSRAVSEREDPQD